jgi:hypothetical protein
MYVQEENLKKYKNSFICEIVITNKLDVLVNMELFEIRFFPIFVYRWKNMKKVFFYLIFECMKISVDYSMIGSDILNFSNFVNNEFCFPELNKH